MRLREITILNKGILLLCSCLSFQSQTINATGTGYCRYNAGYESTMTSPADAMYFSDTIPFDKSQQHSSGWEILFDGKSTGKWKGLNSDSFPSQAWAVKQGALSVKDHAKGEDIITKESYTNFELAFEFNLTFSANSGIKYIVNKIKNNSNGNAEWNGPEYQIIDDYNHPEIKDHRDEKASTAALYLVYSPEHKKLLPAGKWNSGKIIVKGNHIEHWLNGIKVVSCERGTDNFRSRMSATKFKVYDKYGESEAGHIMLTDHDGDQVYYRNIRIRRL